MITVSTPISIGQLVREQPTRSRVFDSLEIDYCCGGKVSLNAACHLKGLCPDEVRRLLAECDAEHRLFSDSSEITADPDAMGLGDLAAHIEETHHDYLKDELPRLERMIEKVVREHGDRDPRLMELRETFGTFRNELVSHMMKEEMVLFPMLRQLERHLASETVQVLPTFRFGGVVNPIQKMESEHEHAGEALARMRRLTDGFTPPDWACNTYRGLLNALGFLERDMHQHVHKENNILFPKAIELEAQLENEDPVPE
jgi:regulator of cell morphogenesis and NO signaling